MHPYHYRIVGSNDPDQLWGGPGNDVLIGMAGDDFLYGGPGNDQLDGGPGNDVLVGGPGSDTLTGGPGDDRFLFNWGSGTDTITDWGDGQDSIAFGNMPRHFRPSIDDVMLDGTSVPGSTIVNLRHSGISITVPGSTPEAFDLSRLAQDGTIRSRAVPPQGPHMLGEVPAYNWYHGCGPTAVASVLGYYDLHGHESYFAASGWDDVRLTVNVQDEISSPEHNAKYDPTPDNPDLPVPAATSIADFMHTSVDPQDFGWSDLGDVVPGIEDYTSLRGDPMGAWTETLTDQTWANISSDIDAGHPMVFLVDTDGNNATDHFVPVFGYDDRPDGTHWFAAYTTWSEQETAVWYEFQPMATGTSWGVFAVTHTDPGGSSAMASAYEPGGPAGDLMAATALRWDMAAPA